MPAPPRAHTIGGHGGVGEETVELAKAVLDRPRGEALARQDALRDADGEAQPLQLGDTPVAAAARPPAPPARTRRSSRRA